MSFLHIYVMAAFLVALVAQIRGRPAWRWFLIAAFLTPLVAGLVVMALPRQQPSLRFSQRQSLGGARANSTIRIIRLSSESDRYRPYNIYVDGVLLGAIVPNNVVDLHVPSGPLAIEARTHWGGSPPLMVEASPTHRIDIEVSNHWGLLRLWAILFHSDRYLTLRRLSAAEAAEMLGNEPLAPAATAA